MNKRVLYLIQQAGMLMDMKRSHARNLGDNTPDTIASHCHHVSVIAYCIARSEGLSHEGGLTAMGIGALHDLLEARTGDSDYISKNYVKVDERKAIDDQFRGLDFADDLTGMMHDYESRTSIEAKCAKDADVVAQLYIEWLLSWRGNKLAEKWYETDLKERLPLLYTESAKELVRQMQGSNPHEWWQSEFKAANIDRERTNAKKGM